MAVTVTIVNSYKVDCQNGVHEAADVWKVALFLSAAALSASTTAYSATNEITGGGSTGYTAGGWSLGAAAATLQGTKGCRDFSDFTQDPTNITGARYALIYNSTSAGKEAMCVIDFGADVNTTNGPFTLDFPVAGSGTSLVRVA